MVGHRRHFGKCGLPENKEKARQAKPVNTVAAAKAVSLFA